MPNGLLLIDKPAGMRSAECVALLKRIFKTRVGHAGTLDSTASGLLVALIGAATRLSDYVMKMPKNYEAVIRLGAATDTCDASGNIIPAEGALKDEIDVSEREFDRVLYSFLGTRMQRPPEISALKVDGKPSHRLARGGLSVGLTPRPVAIASVKRRSPILDGAVKISVACGKGTYIRALARDIGDALGCGAHVETLRRTSVGPFSVEDAYLPSEILTSELSEISQKLRSVKEAGSVFHRLLLTEDAEKKLTHGLCVPLAEAGRYVHGSLELRHGLCVEGAGIIGFADLLVSSGDKVALLLKPRVNIAAGEPCEQGEQK